MGVRNECGYMEWVGAYLLAALDPADLREFVSHAARCPDCLIEIIGLAEVASIVVHAQRVRFCG